MFGAKRLHNFILGAITAIAAFAAVLALVNLNLYPNKSVIALIMALLWLIGFTWVNVYEKALNEWADHE